MPRQSRTIYEHSTHTRALVSFHTDEPNGLNIPRGVTSHPRLGRILNVTTRKELGQPSGSFSIQIKKLTTSPESALRAPPDGLWRDPEDVWVHIKWLVDGQIIDGMLGLIDSISEDTSRSGGGTRSETYTITGRDVGKILETTQLFVNYHHAPERPMRAVASMFATFVEELTGTPSHFVELLLEGWLGNNGGAEQQWVLPRSLGGASFFRVLSRAGLEPMSGLVNGVAHSPALLQFDQTGGTLWDVMQEYANGVMNELFVDLASLGNTRIRVAGELQNQTPVLFHRERPFPIRSEDGRTTNATKWNSLPTHVLEPQDIQRRAIAKGGAAHRFNYWQLQIQGIGTEGYNVDEILQRGIDGIRPGIPGNIPIWNTESIRKDGLRRHMSMTRYLPYFVGRMDEISQPDRENFYRLAGSWLKKIHDWYVIAPYELSGTLSCTRIMPEIRIGQRVKEQRAEGVIVYYVEGVETKYTYGSGGFTQLTVTRGEYEDDDLLDYVYAQYENPRALETAESCFSQLGGERALGVTASAFEELGLFDENCAFRAVDISSASSRAQAAFLSRFAFGEVGEDDSTFTTTRSRSLVAERDGTTPRQPGPRQLIRAPSSSLDDSDPSVGDTSRIPPAAEVADRSHRPGEPSIDERSLERGEPIDGGTDPIFGLGLTGDER